MMSKPSTKYVARICLILAVGLAAAACGSSSPKTSDANSASASPVKVMDIATLTSPGETVNLYPEAPAGAKAAANAINQHGGIGGHPIQIIVCDDQANPDQAATCGRDAVSDHVVAVISQSLFSSSYINELGAASIPLVGNDLYADPDYTSPYSFPVDTSSPALYAGGATELMKKYGVKKISIARIDTPEDLQAVATVTAAVKNGGGGARH